MSQKISQMTAGVQAKPSDQVALLRGGANFRGRILPALTLVDDTFPDPWTLAATDLFVKYTRTDQQEILIPAPTEDGVELVVINGSDATFGLRSTDDEDLFVVGADGETSNIELSAGEVLQFKSQGGLWYYVSRFSGGSNNVTASNVWAQSSLKVGFGGNELSTIKVLEFVGPAFGTMAAGQVKDVTIGTVLFGGEILIPDLNPSLEAGIILQFFNIGAGDLRIRATNVSGAEIIMATINHRVMYIEFA